MIKQFTVLVATMIFTISCTSGKIYPETHSQAMSILSAASSNLLLARYDMTINGYNRAEEKFKAAGDFCNAARAGILLFTSDPNIYSIDFLVDAERNATLGKCESEVEMVNLAHAMTFEPIDNFSVRLIYDNATHNDSKKAEIKQIAKSYQLKSFNKEKLEEPYKTIAEYFETKNIEILKELVKSSKISDRIRSVVYRMIARELIEKDKITAENYLQLAKKLDSQQTWTLNLLYDNLMLQQLYNSNDKEYGVIKQQIDELLPSVKK